MGGEDADIRFVVALTGAEADQVLVEASFQPRFFAGNDRLVLRFLDAKGDRGFPQDLRASASGVQLDVELQPTGSVAQVVVAGVDDVVTVTYRINPTFYPPGTEQELRRRDARSRMSSDLAVLRTRSLLPVLQQERGLANILFRLPPGWTAVTPWEEYEQGYRFPAASLSGVEYIGLGPFRFAHVQAGGALIRIGIAPGAGLMPPSAVTRLLAEQENVAGALAPGPPIRSVVLVSSDFMSGGAAGARSTVQTSSPIVLAHELFHWWFGARLTSPEATWLVEGFTNFYALETGRAAGIISDQLATACLADLNAEMRLLESTAASPISLADASRRYSDDVLASRLVYSKGTLLAEWLKRVLPAREQAQLSALPRAILRNARTRPLTNNELKALFIDRFGDAGREMFDRYVLGVEPLPSLNLPQAKGASGCARFRPE